MICFDAGSVQYCNMCVNRRLRPRSRPGCVPATFFATRCHAAAASPRGLVLGIMHRRLHRLYMHSASTLKPGPRHLAPACSALRPLPRRLPSPAQTRLSPRRPSQLLSITSPITLNHPPLACLYLTATLLQAVRFPPNVMPGALVLAAVPVHRSGNPHGLDPPPTRRSRPLHTDWP